VTQTCKWFAPTFGLFPNYIVSICGDGGSNAD
jgi:hypothetical protein